MSARPGVAALRSATACVTAHKADFHSENNACVFYLSKLSGGSKRIMDVNVLCKKCKELHNCKGLYHYWQYLGGSIWKISYNSQLLALAHGQNGRFFGQ